MISFSCPFCNSSCTSTKHNLSSLRQSARSNLYKHMLVCKDVPKDINPYELSMKIDDAVKGVLG